MEGGTGEDLEARPFLLFTLRLSMVGALLTPVIFRWGLRQAVRWWLPFARLVLAIPLPQIILSSLAFPL